MKTPANPNDPLLRSLAEEAVDLPLKAAGEARRSRALRAEQRRQVALAITVLFCGVYALRIFAPRETDRELIAIQKSPDAPMHLAKHVIVRNRGTGEE